jgi:hypothetical protein
VLVITGPGLPEPDCNALQRPAPVCIGLQQRFLTLADARGIHRCGPSSGASVPHARM